MLEQQLPDLESATLARIQSARSLQDLEQVRIEVLGRKGTLAQVSKEMGKVAPEDRARAGKLLNAAKQNIESGLRIPACASSMRKPSALPPQRRVARSHPPRTRPADRPFASHHPDPIRN